MLNSSQLRLSVLVIPSYFIEQQMELRQYPLLPKRKLKCFKTAMLTEALRCMRILSIFPWKTILLPQSSLHFQLVLCIVLVIYSKHNCIYEMGKVLSFKTKDMCKYGYFH